jgi:integrase
MNNKSFQSSAGILPRGVGKSQREIVGGTFHFRSGMPVSDCSRFGDQVWSWVDTTNERLRIYGPNQLTIKWLALKRNYNLNEEIISDLKKYAFMRCSFSREVFWGNRRNDNAHPATVVTEINVVARFLRHLRAQLSGEGVCLINKLADIEVEDLSDGMSNYQGGPHAGLKKVLTYLSSEALGCLLSCGPLKWNRQDVENLPWNIRRCEPYERLPDELFRWLSDTGTADVKQFLKALGAEPQDKTKIGEGANIYLSAIPHFKLFYEEYVAKLRLFRRRAKGNRAGSRYAAWVEKNGHDVALMGGFVDRARKAAQLIIAMYTGARRSELYSFKVGCLKKDDDGWLMRGTLIKQQGLYLPAGNDKWVAIPIVRDAVMALERAAHLAESDYLFHPAVRRNYNHDESNARGGAIGVWLNKYLRLVDTTEKWKHRKIHVHQFRHTLVFQMRKAGLSLPFITFQLKHCHDALQRRATNTTLGYGGLASEASSRAIEAANLEVMRQVFHPDAPIAGGGATQHKARCAAFFKGMALQGADVDEVLRQLAKKGLPLTDVGAGLCQGQVKVVIDGVKTDPPCIGQLRCNPVRCPNGVIPLYKLPAWRRISDENMKRAQDPELAHAASYHKEAAEEADAVVQFLEKQKRKTVWIEG